jgi:chromosome segregation ATPase
MGEGIEAMTVEEMFQLLLNKIVGMEGEIKSLKEGQARLEAKVDTAVSDIKDIKEDVQYLKRQDDIDTQSINGCYNGIKDLHVKFDKQTGNVKLLDKNYLSLHQRVDTVEDDIEAIKARLDKVS